MSQTQDTVDAAAAAVDLDRIPRPDYKQDAGKLWVMHVCVVRLGVLVVVIDGTVPTPLQWFLTEYIILLQKLFRSSLRNTPLQSTIRMTTMPTTIMMT